MSKVKLRTGSLKGYEIRKRKKTKGNSHKRSEILYQLKGLWKLYKATKDHLIEKQIEDYQKLLKVTP